MKSASLSWVFSLKRLGGRLAHAQGEQKEKRQGAGQDGKYARRVGVAEMLVSSGGDGIHHRHFLRAGLSEYQKRVR